ncbi:MAG: penicillin-binding protein [Candidatus Falkowbacteria bacterium]|nr:penicillin-binding protein [Candidatus Falkowbacteria bacterium]
MPIPQLSNQDWKNQKERNFPRRSFFRSTSRDKDNNSTYNNNSSNNSSGHTPRARSPFKRLANRLIKKFTYLFFILLFLAILGGGVFAFFTFLRVSASLPKPNTLIEREIAQTTKIYDRTGETVLYEIHGDEQRTLISLDKVPNYVKQATIAIEDKDFYKHAGFSLWAMARTMVTNVLKGQKAGASTLTQQLIKNAILTNEKTYTRKIKELMLAYQVEKRFTKDEILQMYLNEIPYGSTSYGIEAASRRYFNKDAKDLSLAEAATLAALPQAPSKYSPYGPNRELLIAREKHVLDAMAEQGYITKDEAEQAKNVPIVFTEPNQNIIAPHFVMYIKEQLSAKYGDKTIEQGGLKIITTLDLVKQKLAEETIKEYADKIKTNYGATNAGLVSIDPKNGQVLTMVGSKDYFSTEIDGQVNITTSARQPGSSIKPLIYSAAFEKGYTPDTILYDVITNFSADPEKTYIPHNYDDKQHGPVPMKQALAGSLNIPAVKTLYLAGLKNVLNLANNAGYTTLNSIDRFGLSLVLGGGEVKMIEHANAFSLFAREGEIHPIVSILSVEDKNGNVLEKFQDKKRQVLTPQTARMINSILTNNDLRSFVFGKQNWLTIAKRPNSVGVKTGTTNDYRDAWAIGYTPSIVTAVWAGNNDNTAMKKGSDGSKVAAPIWHDYMVKILGNTPIEEFKKPEIITTDKPVLDGIIGTTTIIKIDKSSNLLATELTPADYIVEKLYYSPHSILYYVNKDDPRGPVPTNPSQDSQYAGWEDGIKRWVASSTNDLIKKYRKDNKIKDDQAVEISFDPPPTEKDNVHTEENVPNFKITFPATNETITNPIINVTISEITTKRVTINRAELYIDNQLVTVSKEAPYTLTKDITLLQNGLHDLKVKICDDVDNCKEIKKAINLQVSAETKQSTTATISLISPKPGQAINNIDFPLPIEIKLSDPAQIKKINLYYSIGTSTPILLNELTEITQAEIVYKWPTTPPSGEYNLFVDATLATGQIIHSESAKIVIKKK